MHRGSTTLEGICQSQYKLKTKMSTQVFQLLPEQLCYVHCNFCNTILAVNVPSNNMYTIVTVRCGHCANLLSVDLGGLLQNVALQDLQKIQYDIKSQELHMHLGSNSEFSRISSANIEETVQERMLPNRPPEKRQRVPSAYNNFIKEEIQRIKANNPEISHREAFSAAAKNWAHFPHIHFGLTLDTNKQVNCEELISAQGGAPNPNGFY